MSHPIPARRYRHTSGRTASIYGSAPWLSEAERAAWTVEVVGWTVAHPDGTNGLGRVPFATEAEAQAWCDANPNFRGMMQD